MNPRLRTSRTRKRRDRDQNGRRTPRKTRRSASVARRGTVLLGAARRRIRRVALPAITQPARRPASQLLGRTRPHRLSRRGHVGISRPDRTHAAGTIQRIVPIGCKKGQDLQLSGPALYAAQPENRRTFGYRPLDAHGAPDKTADPEFRMERDRATAVFQSKLARHRQSYPDPGAMTDITEEE